MRDWSDSMFDEVITHALRSAVITPRQRRRAWERLEQNVALQTMLPPLATPVRRPRRPHPLRQILDRAARAVDWGLSMLFDDTCYDRALRNRHARVNLALFESPLRNLLGGVAT